MGRPWSNRWWCVALAAVLSCAKPAPKVEVRAPTDPKDEVRQALRALYGAADVATAKALLSPSASVFFGTRASETFSASDAAAVLFPAGPDGVPLTAGALTVHVVRGGQSAWLWDLPRRGNAPVPLRLTAHAVRLGERWLFDAIHLSEGVADEALEARDAMKRFPPPAAVVAERGPDSEQLIGLTKRLLEDLAVKVERTGDASEIVLLGTSPAERIEGGATFKSLVKPQLTELKKAGFQYRVEGGLRAQLAPDAKSGWVAGVVKLKIGTGKKAKTLPAFRALWIFEEHDELWDLVSEHQSVGLPGEAPKGRVIPSRDGQMGTFD